MAATHGDTSGVRREPFGATSDGRPVDQFTLENARGMRVRLLTLGGIVRSIVLPDGHGHDVDVVLGFDRVEDYLADGMCVGALIGCYANRIAGGYFTLDGVDYQLPLNQGPNHMHGGRSGFHCAVWDAEPSTAGDGPAVELRHRSVNGDGGFPGNLDVRVRYALDDSGALSMTWGAVTDQATPISFTTHSYFNLAGHAAGGALDQELMLNASRFTPLDDWMIPTGELRPVRDTPFDFREPAVVGARLDAPSEQLAIAYGYDHNFIIDRPANESPVSLALAAMLREPVSGRWMQIHTTEPGIQLYIGGGLNTAGKDGAHYAAHAGLALEPQHFPDSPNQPSFPSTILRPGETFRSRTIYQFGAD